MLADAYEEPGTLQRIRVHCPTVPAFSPASLKALGAERITSRLRAATICRASEADADAPRRRRRLSRAAAKILEAQGYHVVISPVLE